MLVFCPGVHAHGGTLGGPGRYVTEQDGNKSNQQTFKHDRCDLEQRYYYFSKNKAYRTKTIGGESRLGSPPILFVRLFRLLYKNLLNLACTVLSGGHPDGDTLRTLGGDTAKVVELHVSVGLYRSDISHDFGYLAIDLG